MASSNLVLTYFDIRGLAEVSRIILAAGDKEYKDVRLTREQWHQGLKEKAPLQQVPTLEIDGEVYPQSIPIWTFLAREFGLYPSSTKDQLVVDVVSAVYADISKTAATWFYDSDGAEKDKKRAKAKENAVKYLDFLEDLLRKNGTGYVVGRSVTLADIVIFDIVTGYPRLTLNYSPNNYPLIAKNNENVLKVERIGAYISSRPDSDL